MANNTGKKYGGRVKGVKNKNTAIVGAFCEYLTDSGYIKFKNELEKLNGSEYVRVFVQLLKMSQNNKNDFQSNDILIDILKAKTEK